MKTLTIAILIAIFASPLFCFSEETKPINGELENLSGQCAECAAYYELVFYALSSPDNSKKLDTGKAAKAYMQLSDTLALYSGLLAMQGRDFDTAVEVTKARIEIYKKQMGREAHNRNENISILINKYHDECTQLVQSPPEPLKRIIQLIIANK